MSLDRRRQWRENSVPDSEAKPDFGLKEYPLCTTLVFPSFSQVPNSFKTPNYYLEVRIHDSKTEMDFFQVPFETPSFLFSPEPFELFSSLLVARGAFPKQENMPQNLVIISFLLMFFYLDHSV